MANETTPARRRRFGANISMMFTEVPLLDRFARARAAGFEAVEMQFPYDEADADALADAARDAGVAVALVNVPVIVPDEPMLSSAPGQEARFRDAAATAKRYVAALGCEKVNVLPGDRIKSAAREAQIAVYRANLAHAADEMAEVGARVVCEPINTVDRPSMLIARADEMAEVLEGLGRDDVGIQFDIYHVAMMGERPAETFARHERRVGHVQFADAPGRHQPGTGAVDFAEIFAAIDASAYDGWLNAEYAPDGVTEDGLAWLETFALAVA